ncbi:TetR/AcrR family transcriptional regulator [Psychromonas ossibalaenae]|uniref:TetR/AcrR family transcriptional regulator n=1 Tax=Psychromonas ossibalaenae TaxID=444922 RepID=UPI0003706CBD|nr:TetR/AcrR family transcriptional regulator [Psychromonas ossibalaenae]
MNSKKRSIIESAFKLFYNKGIHAVGINEIIKTANVAKKTLYNHFESKDELILATLEYRDQLYMSWLTESLDKAELGKDALLVLFEALDDWLNGRAKALGPFKGCYFINTCAEYGDVNKQIYLACKEHKDNIKALIQVHVDSFEANAQKNALLVETICLLKEGVITTALVQKESTSAQNAGACLENLLRFKR